VVVLGIALVVISLLLLPLVIFLFEALLVVGSLLILRGTWIVEASTVWPKGETKTWKVRGWRRSKRALDEVLRELEMGVDAAPEDSEAEPVVRSG
jgi:hypothetical protein